MLSHWENTPEHWRNFGITVFGFVPLAGELKYLKYSDEIADSLKAVNKMDEVAEAAQGAGKLDEVADVGKGAGKADEAADAAQGAGKADEIAEGAGSKVKFGSDAKSADKLNRQMNNRGWTKDSVTDTVYDAFTTRKAANRATGNSATVYYNKDGSHVIVDDITNEIVQVSDKFDVNWKPDDSIINLYLP